MFERGLGSSANELYAGDVPVLGASRDHYQLWGVHHRARYDPCIPLAAEQPNELTELAAINPAQPQRCERVFPLEINSRNFLYWREIEKVVLPVHQRAVYAVNFEDAVHR